jgi:hypothetical protein
MLRYALRRVLWSIPTLLATSLFLFLVVTTLAPAPITPAGAAPGDAGDRRIEEARRSQFFDLPRFVNADPRDVRSNAREALTRVAAEDPGLHDAGARALERLGGAALPYVLPLLD